MQLLPLRYVNEANWQWSLNFSRGTKEKECLSIHVRSTSGSSVVAVSTWTLSSVGSVIQCDGAVITLMATVGPGGLPEGLRGTDGVCCPQSGLLLGTSKGHPGTTRSLGSASVGLVGELPDIEEEDHGSPSWDVPTLEATRVC